jgi:hypothetical protein
MTFCQHDTLPTYNPPTEKFANMTFANMTSRQHEIRQHDYSPTFNSPTGHFASDGQVLVAS